jgi:hypothetical protein
MGGQWRKTPRWAAGGNDTTEYKEYAKYKGNAVYAHPPAEERDESGANLGGGSVVHKGESWPSDEKDGGPSKGQQQAKGADSHVDSGPKGSPVKTRPKKMETRESQNFPLTVSSRGASARKMARRRPISREGPFHRTNCKTSLPLTAVTLLDKIQHLQLQTVIGNTVCNPYLSHLRLGMWQPSEPIVPFGPLLLRFSALFFRLISLLCCFK